jgi:mRNA interferase HigB
MHLISFGKLKAEASKFPDISCQIHDWRNSAKNADWKHLEDVRQVHASAEAVGNFTVFNVKGNAYRLIVDIDYEEAIIYFKHFLTHADYDKEKWKNDRYFQPYNLR